MIAGGFMKQLFLVALAFSLVGCGEVGPTPANSQSRFDELQLSYGPCFGTCPVFTVTLNESGSLTYEGDRFVFASGRHRRLMNPSLFQEVVALIETLPETELIDPLQCPRRRTDHARVDGRLRTAKHDLEINHYYGCSGYEYRKRQITLIRKLTDMLQIDDLVGWDPNRRIR